MPRLGAFILHFPPHDVVAVPGSADAMAADFGARQIRLLPSAAFSMMILPP